METFSYELERVEAWAPNNEEGIRVEREFGDDTAYVYIWTGVAWEQDDSLTCTVGKYSRLDNIAAGIYEEVFD